MFKANWSQFDCIWSSLFINWLAYRHSISQEICTRFCFAVLCCGYTLTDFPISIRLTSLALWQSNDCPSASKATLINMDKYFMWIHYERLYNHNKAKHNKTVCIFLGIYCNVCIKAKQFEIYSVKCVPYSTVIDFLFDSKLFYHNNYRKTSSISRTKFQSLNVSCILLQLSSLNPLNSSVKLRMKM